MRNQVINTFALIGVFTVIAIACSSALSEDDDVIIPNNNNNSVVVDNNTNTNTNTNTSTTGTSATNTSVQENEVGRYHFIQVNTRQAWIIDTKTGSIMVRDSNDFNTVAKLNTWIPLPN
jgi:hypothetical protein